MLKKYTIRQEGLTIDPGVKIVIPLQAIQNYEKYYDNADQYLPEWWTAGEISQKTNISISILLYEYFKEERFVFLYLC